MAKLLADKIAEYVKSVNYNNLTNEAIEEAKKRIIDSIAVALPTYNEIPIRIIYETIKNSSQRKGATLWGTKKKVPIDYASFYNSSMTRYIDYNDTYLSKEALHPSDSIAGLFSITESMNLSGKDLLTSIIIDYEIICRLADAASIRERGWDHVSYIAIGVAAGASKLLDLDIKKIVQAINLTASNVITLRQVRIGELSMWKGLSAPNATRNAIFYTMLAANGMTGPAPVFEGERGFFKQVSGELDLDKFGGYNTKEFKIFETSIKFNPVEYHSMSAAEIAVRLHNKIVDVSKIKNIDVDTFNVAYQIIVKDPEKWEPKTKETADHSMPYIIAHCLIYGKITKESYYENALKDERVRALMKRINIKVDNEIDKLYPQGVPTRITITLDDGSKISEELIYPKGHYKNPLTKEELNDKFLALVEPLLKENAKELLNKLWNLDKLNDLKEIVELMRFR